MPLFKPAQTVPWTAFVPTVTAPGGTPSTYTATSTGKYMVIGKMCFVTFYLFNSAGGTAGAGAVDLLFSLPVTAVQTESTPNVVPAGSAVVYNGTATGFVLMYLTSTTNAVVRGTDTSVLSAAGQNNAVRLVEASLTYQVA